MSNGLTRFKPAPAAKPTPPPAGRKPKSESKSETSAKELKWKSIDDPFTQFTHLINGAYTTGVVANSQSTHPNVLRRRNNKVVQEKTLWQASEIGIQVWTLTRTMTNQGRAYKPDGPWQLFTRERYAFNTPPALRNGQVSAAVRKSILHPPTSPATTRLPRDPEQTRGLEALGYLPTVVQEGVEAAVRGSHRLFGSVVQGLTNGVPSTLEVDLLSVSDSHVAAVHGLKQVNGDWDNNVDISPWQVTQISGGIQVLSENQGQPSIARVSAADKLRRIGR